MFDRISSALQGIFRNLRGYGKLSERNVQDAVRDIRLALLEADVNYHVVRDFTARVKERCLGDRVLGSITPGQQFIKEVHDELAALLGTAPGDFDLSARPSVVLLLGLHGSGKTTTAAKLALRWKKAGRQVLLVACDIRRPAAVEQLRLLAAKVVVPVVEPRPGEAVPALGRRALEEAGARGCDVVVYDTGGRFQIDEELVRELKDLRDAVPPQNTVLVLDAAIGQESVNVAKAFHEAVGLTGLVLTKLDGDARGGAALSVRAVTGCPVLLVGTGERLEDLELFHPDRMASRILGMGDVVSLVEKAQAALDPGAMEEAEEKLLEGRFTLDDFLGQLQQFKKMGPLENLLEMLPGGANVPAHAKTALAAASEGDVRKAEAILRSMTPQERRRPEVLDASRRRRVARGSGTEVRDVNELLNRFEQARQLMRRMRPSQKRLRRPRK